MSIARPAPGRGCCTRHTGPWRLLSLCRSAPTGPSARSPLKRSRAPAPTSSWPTPSTSRCAPALFGIVQGGFDLPLRRQAADETAELGLPGYAIGGLSVGESKAMTYDLLSAVTERLPAACPRYLMGVGAPPSLVEGVRRGVDMFDCVMPTRIGRTGMALTSAGPLGLRRAAFAEDLSPLEPGCPCPACRHYPAFSWSSTSCSSGRSKCSRKNIGRCWRASRRETGCSPAEVCTVSFWTSRTTT